MKRFAMILLSTVTLIGGIGIASAQMRGGGFHGGASSGGASSGGAWHGGGNWHGGNWNNGWHGGHSHFVIGVGFGAPFWGWWPGYYYPYGYASYYPTYYGDYYPYGGYGYGYDYSAPAYIQQGAPTYQPSAPAYGQGRMMEYSYYCPDPAGYYPQVPTCAKGWLRVVPQSAPGPTGPTSY